MYIIFLAVPLIEQVVLYFAGVCQVAVVLHPALSNENIITKSTPTKSSNLTVSSRETVDAARSVAVAAEIKGVREETVNVFI